MLTENSHWPPRQILRCHFRGLDATGETKGSQERLSLAATEAGAELLLCVLGLGLRSNGPKGAYAHMKNGTTEAQKERAAFLLARGIEADSSVCWGLLGRGEQSSSSSQEAPSEKMCEKHSHGLDAEGLD